MQERKVIALIVIVIIALSVFAVTIQCQVLDLGKEKKEDTLSLSVKVFADTYEGVAPLTVNFSSIVLNYEGEVIYHWDFGDGETSSKKSPSHTYHHIESNESNDTKSEEKQISTSYICTLAVKDRSGEEETDKIPITAIGNRPPDVTIRIKTQTIRRPLSIFEFAPEKTIHFDSYGGQDWWVLRNKSLLPKFFTSKDGFIDVSAVASDKDGDQIVSYHWSLEVPPYTPRLSNKPVYQVFRYTGEAITIPIEDVYVPNRYNLKVIVTDSAGREGEANVQFEVKKSDLKSQFEGMTQKKEILRKDIWIDKLAEDLGPTISSVILGFFYDDIIDKMDAPIIELIITIAVMKAALNWVLIGPNELIQNLIDAIVPILDTYEILGKLVDRSLVGIQNIIRKIEDITNKEHPMLIEIIETLRETLGFNNKRPIIEDPYPRDGSTYNPRDTEYVQIYVNDLHLDSKGNIPEGENNTFTVTINGDYIDKDVYKYENVSTIDGPFRAYFNTSGLPDNILPPIEQIRWTVTVVDFQGDIVEPGEGLDPDKYFKFTTLS